MSDLDIEIERQKLRTYSFDQLVEIALDLRIQRESDREQWKADLEMAQDIGYGKGYECGRQDERDERRDL